MSLGNPDFIIHFWEFTKIPTLQWSLPVHFFGLVWIIFWNLKLLKKPIILPIIAALSFFLFAEVLNKNIFHFFDYSSKPFGPEISFWLVILLYAWLCTICSLVLRFNADYEIA